MRTNAPRQTAWGRWVRKQPKGALTQAMLATGLAWSTVCKARTRLVTHEVAVLLSEFTRGEVSVADLAKKPSSAGIEAARKRAASA